MTKLLGVIGDPIHHSLSPLIHRAWLREAGFDATYEAMQVPGGELEAALETLKKRDLVGLNITLPHKLDAAKLSHDQSEIVQKIGAANTLTLLESGRWRADNTDVPGFLASLARAGHDDLAAKRILILGAGGSARAVAYALHSQGADLAILNRTVEKAAAISKELTDERSAHGPLDQYTDYSKDAELVINTLALGYSGDVLLLPEGAGRYFVDISYGAAAAGQLSEAQRRGWKTMDGLGMLIEQAAESFRIWFGVDPDVEGALARCRKLVEETT